MEKVSITAQIRQRVGKETAKKQRKQGLLPAIIYGKDINLAILLPHQSQKILKAINFTKNAIINIQLNGSENQTIPTLIKDIQYHPVTEEIIHIDFLKVSLAEKIKVSVPIVLKGEAKGVKEGGILEQILWNLEIEGLLTDIPEKIEVDISDLGIGHSLHVFDLKIPESLKVITDKDATIVTVAKKVEEVSTTEEAPQGPEVIKEKKETTEEEAKKETKAKEEKDTDKAKSK